MEQMYKITIGDQIREYPAGTPFSVLAKEYQKDYNDDIVLVLINNRLSELTKKIEADCSLEFITTGDEAGKTTYRRSVTLLMQRAIHNVDESLSIRVLHSIGQGFYCELSDGTSISKDFLLKLKVEMMNLVDQDLPIIKENIHTEEAIQLFHDLGMNDKEKLFRYRLNSSVNIYKIGNYVDYYYGYMVPSTGYLTVFDLAAYDDGFVLLFSGKNTREVAEFKPSGKLFQTLKKSSEWGKMCGIATLGDLNDKIAEGKIQNIMLVQEALMERRIGELAEVLAKDRHKKFVMIAGPSSSGKTSFSHRLSIQL
ncbi:MAG: nucleoside kinase, partial [Lachnospiraceae bacterium]